MKYLNHEIGIYSLDVCRWYITIDDNYLLKYENGEGVKSVQPSKNEAVISACSFVRSMVEDE